MVLHVYTSLLISSIFILGGFGKPSPAFSPPAACPVCASSNYIGQNNGSLAVQPRVTGKAYSRFIQIWLENTDFSTAQASSTFKKLASEGILLTNYNGVTHPSEPNYVASISGDFFGMSDDKFYALPVNVSTQVDLLEARNISWATYQENMPYSGFSGDYAQKNYLDPSSKGSYTYYMRKHNPLIICNSIASVPARMNRIRNFNDFAIDVNASALPSWVFITPNLVNDGHDTDITFVSDWLEYFLVPLLDNPNFDDNETLVLLTFDENEDYKSQNTLYTLLLGGAVSNHKGTVDSTFYTHYSSLSSVQNNWGLGSLGRQDTNTTVAAVFQFQAKMTNHTNTVSDADPLMNLSGVSTGVCASERWIPVTAPNMSAVGAGAGPVFASNITSTVSVDNTTPLNLNAMGLVNPATVIPSYSAPSTDPNANATSSPPVTSSKSTAGQGYRIRAGPLGVVCPALAILLL
ncbi:hypothetical protein QFC21_002725 [Naganishia friedmannii]|uniref:Uncharacterized protein n=1 Tax=Naganishia friedmannii TaxID=89922 RepID=A0ACC2VSE0_9TREE|nr:hypothetical protein QFC21_002725 [Naganishia friedmannii]